MPIDEYKKHLVQEYYPFRSIPFIDLMNKELQLSPLDFTEIKSAIMELYVTNALRISGCMTASAYENQDRNVILEFLSDTVIEPSRQLTLF